MTFALGSPEGERSHAAGEDESDRSGLFADERRQAVRLRGVLGAGGGVKVNEQTGWPVVAFKSICNRFPISLHHPIARISRAE